MRTLNCKCLICEVPLYRRPSQLLRVRHAACMKHRAQAQVISGITEKQKQAMSLGREKGTNHRTGYKHREESKRKASESHKLWCVIHPERVIARGEKTRGANHYRWNGGSSRLNTAIRTLTEHRKWMDSIKDRDGLCGQCGATEHLESHHIIPLAELILLNGVKAREQARNCESLWDLSNGITLCIVCHYQLHGRRYAN